MGIALFIAIVVLYSLGHWIGATVLLAVFLFMAWQEYDDPTGLKRLRDRFRQ